MDNVTFSFRKLILIFCFFGIFAATTQSKAEFKIIELPQQYDPILNQSFDIIPFSLVTTHDDLVYVSMQLGVRAYKISTGEFIKEITFPRSNKLCSYGLQNPNKIELSQDEKYLFVQAKCEILQVDIKTNTIQKVLFTLGEDGSATHSFAVSPDQSLLAVSTSHCIACIWDLKTNKLLVQFIPGFDKFGDLKFSSDSKMLLIAGRNMWFRSTNKLIKFKPYIKDIVLNNAGYVIEFLSNNKSFISAGVDRDVLQKNSITGDVIVRYKNGVRTDAFALSPDEKLLATGSYGDLKVRLFSVKTGKLLKVFEGHTKLIDTLVFSKDNKKLISGSPDQTIYIWNLN